MQQHYDAIVTGLGHNGLVTLLGLAQRGVKVLGLEEKPNVGGACVSMTPFKKAPQQRFSRAAYLFGPFAPQIERALDFKIPTIERDPWYFVPMQDGRYFLSGSDKVKMRALFDSFFTNKDWLAYSELNDLMSKMCHHVAPAWLQAPTSLQETADRWLPSGYVRDQFVKLCSGSVGEFLDQFEFDTQMLPIMEATTDGFTSAHGTYYSKNTGPNYLAHRMVQGNGIWKIVPGGMGTVTQLLKTKAIEHGAEVRTGARVTQIIHQNGVAKGVALADGTEIFADVVICTCDPWRVADMVGQSHIPTEHKQRLAEWRKFPGLTAKVNLLMKGNPSFTCLNGKDVGQFRTTTHILAPVPDSELKETYIRSFNEAAAGRMPEFPEVEMMFHPRELDPSIGGPEGYDVAGIFCQFVPNKWADGSTWQERKVEVAERLLDICQVYAPDIRDHVVEYEILTPDTIEREFGLTNGHICQVDHGFTFSARAPVHQPGLQGLLNGGAAAFPGGAVTGCPGFIALNEALFQLGKKPFVASID